MKLAQEIILKPVITEKSMLGAEAKKYTFKVAKDATKIDIARAIASRSSRSTPSMFAVRAAVTVVSREPLLRGKRLPLP